MRLVSKRHSYLDVSVVSIFSLPCNLKNIRDLRYGYEIPGCIIFVKAVSYLPQASQILDPSIHSYVESRLFVHLTPPCNELNSHVNFLRLFLHPNEVQLITCTEVFLYVCHLEGSRTFN